jgi:WhiB family redox-sensing transcriptional regulator
MSARAVAWSPGAAGPLLAEDVRWWHRAACLGVDPEIFFARPEAPETAKAKALCAGCPVLGDCLADALKAGDTDCVRGGMTWPERRGLGRPERPARRLCVKRLHVMDEANSAPGGRCRACRSENQRKNNPPTGRGRGNSAVPRERSRNGQFAGAIQAPREEKDDLAA